MSGFQIRAQSAAGLSQAVGVIVLSLYCATAVLAQEIPDYDTEAFCERRAGSSAPENRRFASCLLAWLNWKITGQRLMSRRASNASTRQTKWEAM
jgi:hypothetical protein